MNPRLAFAAKVQRMMRETSKSYYECCSILGRRGGAKRAAEARLRRAAAAQRSAYEKGVGVDVAGELDRRGLW